MALVEKKPGSPAGNITINVRGTVTVVGDSPVDVVDAATLNYVASGSAPFFRFVGGSETYPTPSGPQRNTISLVDGVVTSDTGEKLLDLGPKFGRGSIHGHSLAQGQTALRGGYNQRLFSGALGMSYTSPSTVLGNTYLGWRPLAVGGAVAAYGESGSANNYDGGFGKALADLNGNVYLPPTAANNGGSSWTEPNLSVGVVHYGLNDAGFGGEALKNAYINAMRTVISRYRTSCVIENDDAAVTYSGPTNASNIAITGSNSGSSVTLFYTNGSVALSLPASFPGGTVAAVLTTVAQYVGTLSFKIDGVEKATKTITDADQPPSSTNRKGSACIRVQVPAGAHTLKLDMVTGNGLFLDCFQVETEVPPVLVVPSLNKFPSTTAYGGSLSDTIIDSYNAALRTLCSEFDQWVRYVDIQPVLGDMKSLSNPNFFGDLLHWNDLGHSRVAALLYRNIIEMKGKRSVEDQLRSY